MNIKKLQEYASNNSVSPQLFDRIMGDNLTHDDVNFLEKAISVESLIEIGMQTEHLLKELQKLGIEMNERKSENEYSIKLVDWLIENIRPIHDRCEYIGLTDIEIKESFE